MEGSNVTQTVDAELPNNLSKPDRPGAFKAPGARLLQRNESLALIAALILCAIGAFLSPTFLTFSNLWSVLAITSMLTIASAGQTLIILSGNQGIDLSVGAVMTLTALMASSLTGGSDFNLIYAVAAALAIGATVGLINFIGVYLVGLYPIVMTLGTSFAVMGLAFLYVQAQGPSQPSSLLVELGVGRIGQVPWMVVLGAVVVGLISFVLHFTRYGTKLYLIGTSHRAARAAGLPVARLLSLTYMTAGALSGFAGVILYGFAGSVNLSIGQPYMLMSIAAAVIGGVTLSGGRGTYIGTAIGALVFTLLTNLLITAGLSTALRDIFSGLVLIAVLATTSRENDARS